MDEDQVKGLKLISSSSQKKGTRRLDEYLSGRSWKIWDWGQKVWVWTSLVVQWLRIHLAMQETGVWFLVWEDPTCHGTTKPMHHNSWAGGHLEPVPHNRRSHHNEKPIAGSQREELRPWQKSWGRRLDIRKGGIEPQEFPWKFSSIYPQNQSLPTLLPCALTYTSDFKGGLPHHLFRRRSWLRAPVTNNSWAW